MEKRLFVTAAEVANDFEISRTKAYNMIRQMNEELEQRGYLTVAGRVSRKYYLERIYGGEEAVRQG